MIGFKEYNVLSEMPSEEYMRNAEMAADLFNSEIGKMFGKDYKPTARIVKILGYNLMFQFADAHYKVTIHNSPVHLSWMMQFGDSKSSNIPDIKKFDAENLNRSYQLKINGVKARKTSGKSPMDVAKKLIIWFKKNKENIIKTYKENK